jgi:hypothetical protein
MRLRDGARLGYTLTPRDLIAARRTDAHRLTYTTYAPPGTLPTPHCTAAVRCAVARFGVRQAGQQQRASSRPDAALHRQRGLIAVQHRCCAQMSAKRHAAVLLLLDGTFEVISPDGGGTFLRARIPL